MLMTKRRKRKSEDSKGTVFLKYLFEHLSKTQFSGHINILKACLISVTLLFWILTLTYNIILLFKKSTLFRKLYFAFNLKVYMSVRLQAC